MNGLWNNADNTKQVIVQHTTESEGGNTSVIGYLERTKAGSYQTMVDFDGEEVRLVPDNKQAWGAMPKGNKAGLHTCVMGRAEWSRDRWLREAKLLERTAMRYAEWHKKYGIPLVKINGDQVRAGVRGVCGHIEIRDAFRESDHWDPGYNFPYDVVIERAKQIAAGGGGNKGDVPMSAAEVADIKDFITKFVGPIGSDVKDIREQLCGEGQRNAGQYKGWKQLGGKTLVDAVADLLKGGK